MKTFTETDNLTQQMAFGYSVVGGGESSGEDQSDDDSDDDTETPSDEEGCPTMPDYADPDSEA